MYPVLQTPINWRVFAVVSLYLSGFMFQFKGTNAVKIEEFGAVAGDSSLETAFANSRAIEKAFESIQSEEHLGERVVEVPEGERYFVMPIEVSDTTAVKLSLEGTLVALNAIDQWPQYPESPGHFLPLLNFIRCKDVVISGGGDIRGRGHDWWWRVVRRLIDDHRPHLIYFFQTSGVLIEHVRLYNSPMYHIKLEDVEKVVIRHVIIRVDVTQQATLLVQTGYWNHTHSLPMFPLNTDGIDPDGRDIHIYNISVTNFDDVVAVKPSYMTDRVYANCTENVLVENATVQFGVGMTVGTVGPHVRGNCVRNVTFRNVEFQYPFKAVYIKTNPGDEGFGIIDGILYENIYIRRAIWWPIYIGPQQQKQPDGSGPGCMLFPIMGDECATQPRVTISNVVLRNVTSEENVLRPGVIRCHEDNPCTGFFFEDVVSTPYAFSPLSRGGWYCDNVNGIAINSKPDISCLRTLTGDNVRELSLLDGDDDADDNDAR